MGLNGKRNRLKISFVKLFLDVFSHSSITYKASFDCEYKKSDFFLSLSPRKPLKKPKHVSQCF